MESSVGEVIVFEKCTGYCVPKITVECCTFSDKVVDQ